MGIVNKIFVVCDRCEAEVCIDETGQCGSPFSELLPSGWVEDKKSFDFFTCPDCRSKPAPVSHGPDRPDNKDVVSGYMDAKGKFTPEAK